VVRSLIFTAESTKFKITVVVFPGIFQDESAWLYESCGSAPDLIRLSQLESCSRTNLIHLLAREGRREGRVGERSEGKGGKERERREEKGEGRCERLHHGCWGMNASELHCLNLNINFTLPR